MDLAFWTLGVTAWARYSSARVDLDVAAAGCVGRLMPDIVYPIEGLWGRGLQCEKNLGAEDLGCKAEGVGVRPKVGIVAPCRTAFHAVSVWEVPLRHWLFGWIKGITC
jgi:hypothetical protein